MLLTLAVLLLLVHKKMQMLEQTKTESTLTACYMPLREALTALAVGWGATQRLTLQEHETMYCTCSEHQAMRMAPQGLWHACMLFSMHQSAYNAILQIDLQGWIAQP